MSEHLHYITHTHDTGYRIKTRFTCTGGRTSPCHLYQPDPPDRITEWPEDDTALRAYPWRDTLGLVWRYGVPGREHGWSTGSSRAWKGLIYGPWHREKDAEVEAWGEADRAAAVAHDDCWMKFWMEDAGCAETCCPDGEPVRSGPITVTWNGDCVEWEYAEEEA